MAIKMKKRLKIFWLGFFSDKLAREAPTRGYGNLILAGILAVILMFCGYIASIFVPFRANFNGSAQFNQVVENVFSESSPDRISLEIKQGKLLAGKGETGRSKVLDTRADPSANEVYSTCGYTVVVDTRPADGVYDDFIAYCQSAGGTEISYEKYLELNADEKTLYTFKIRYTGNERILDDEWITRCESYLNGCSDEAAVKGYEEVKKLTGEEYKRALYELYIKSYYPDLSVYETSGSAPTVRNAYYHNYLIGNKFLFLFDDAIVCSFVKDSGVPVTFYGFYNNIEDGAVEPTASALRDFIAECYKGSASITVYSALINFTLYLPFVVVVVILLALIMLCVRRLLKIDGVRLGGCVKTMAVFLVYSALLAALIALGFGFIIEKSALLATLYISFFLILMIRMAIMLVIEKINAVRQSKVNNDTVCR